MKIILYKRKKNKPSFYKYTIRRILYRYKKISHTQKDVYDFIL